MKRSILIAALCWSALEPYAFAQPVAGLGAISGTIRDASGAVVPDAVVEVLQASKGVRRTLKSNEAGIFSAPALVPASGYVVTVTKPGFASFQAREIEVQVGQDVELRGIILDATVHTTLIAVEETTPLVEHTKTGISQVVNSSQIQNLPINGRRVDSFVLLTPAVVPDGTRGLVSFRGIPGGNAFLTDGNDTSNQFFHENAGRTRITTQISQDAVQEFRVLSSGYSAEFGRALGGIISTVTRSGTNMLHGTAYWFFRNRSLNARDRYSSVNPPEKRYQTGASVGGKLIKDELFYFFNVESPRRSFPLVASLTGPPLFDKLGRFIGSCRATPAQCEAALGFLGRQFQVLDRTANSELAFGRIDWRPGSRHSVSASFNYLRWISKNGFQTQASLNDGQGVGGNGNSSVRTRYGRLAWTSITSSGTTNEARFGWFKDRHFDDLNPSLIPEETGLTQITVEGQTNLGVSSEMPRLYPSENRFQFADTFAWVTGKHLWKFGFDVVNTQDFVRVLRNGNGSYVYPDFTSFAQDFSGNIGRAKRWQQYSQRFGDETIDVTIRDYSFFAQDQFRLAANFTLNYGVRYEYAQLPRPQMPNPEYPETGRIPSPGTNFAPRVGVAIGLNGSKTVLRVGYGLFFARYHGGLINTFFLENGVAQRLVSLEQRFLSEPELGPVFPERLPSDRGVPAGPPNPAFVSTVDLTIPSSDYRNPYSQQGDIGIDQSITPNLALTVSYLWNRSLHLTTVRDLNVGPTGSPISFRIEDASGNQVGRYTTPTYRLVNRVNPRWRRVNQVDSGGNSYYHGMAVQLRKRVSKGFEGFVSYTWSHAIDFNQGGGRDNIFFNEGPRSLWNGDYRAEKSSSQLDQRHRFVAGSIWTPTFTSHGGWVGRYLVNDWQLSQISTFASARPATPTVLVLGVPFPGAAFNTTLNGFGGSTRVPFLPASSLDIDQVVRTDIRLTKILRFRERYEAHFNFEAFNAFNHSWDTSVNTEAYELREGILKPMPRLGEGSASEGYPDGTNARRAQVSLRFIW